MAVKDLIAKASAKATCTTLSAAARKDVAEVLKYNDSAHKHRKISRDQVVAMLAKDHGVQLSSATLDRWCKEALGRTFGGRSQ